MWEHPEYMDPREFTHGQAKPLKAWEAVLGGAAYVLFTSFALGLGGLGVIKYFPDILRQHQALTTWQPVQVQVISAWSEAVPIGGSGLSRIFDATVNEVFGTDIAVWVSYRYQVEGREYVSGSQRPPPPFFESPYKQQLSGEKWSGQVGPPTGGQATGPRAWAQKTLSGFVPENPCWAYYDPHDPSKSFLLKEYGFSPYGGTLGGLIFLLVGIFMVTIFLGAWWNHPAPRPAPAWLTWFGWIAAFSYSGVNGWVLAHYWLHADQPLARGWAPVGWSLYAGLVALVTSIAFVAYFVCSLRDNTSRLPDEFTPVSIFDQR
jgi:hypothetical protein